MQENNTTPATPEKNMTIYNSLRSVPEEAKKPIKDGRLAGKTDVNAMWRIKRLTEVFGQCGFGWKYVIKNQRLEEADKDNMAAFVEIDLYVRDPETQQWSEPIPGIGGNIFKRRERSGNLFMDDDCFKKALTDAISIAGKALGLAADVWYEQDVSKYEGRPSEYAGATTRSTGQQQGSGTRQGSKIPLTPQSPAWTANVTKVASTPGSLEDIRKRIETKYIITDADCRLLFIQAGKLQDEHRTS